MTVQSKSHFRPGSHFEAIGLLLPGKRQTPLHSTIEDERLSWLTTVIAWSYLWQPLPFAASEAAFPEYSPVDRPKIAPVRGHSNAGVPGCHR
jgi:hypothetical protein